MKRLFFYLSFVLFFVYGAIAFAANERSGTSGTYIDWLNIILFAIGLIFLGWYQKYQIGILRKELESQKSIISSLRQYSDILDLNKIKEFVHISEETIQKKKEIEMAELQNNLDSKIKLIESEREQLLSKISKSSETIESIKADYEAAVKRNSQRITAIYRYREMTQLLELLYEIQARLLIYANALILLKKIETVEEDKLGIYSEQIANLSNVLRGVLDSFNQMNIAEIDEDLRMPVIFTGFNIQETQMKMSELGVSLSSDIDQLIAKLRQSVT